MKATHFHCVVQLAHFCAVLKINCSYDSYVVEEYSEFYKKFLKHRLHVITYL